MIPCSTFPIDKRIAFTGRFASLSRASAIEILTKRGGLFRSRVTPRTDILVIGADGWPLRSSGTLTRNLSLANQLQESGHEIVVIGEASFIRQLDALSAYPPVRAVHTIEQTSRLLGVSGLRIRRWIELGLLQSSTDNRCSPTFDYQAIAAAKQISQWMAAGVAPSQLAKTLRTLQRWLPNDRLLHGSIVALEKRPLVRTELGQLIDRFGQMHFAFDEVEEAKMPFQGDPSLDPDQLFDSAYSAEKSGRYDDAVRQYQLWTDTFGIDTDVQFNRANVLAQIGQIEAAIELYREVVQASPKHTSAWNNLGLCQYRSGENLAAIHSLQRAADLDPHNINTLYNLADALEESGHVTEAHAIWTRIVQSRIPDKIVDYAQDRLFNDQNSRR